MCQHEVLSYCRAVTNLIEFKVDIQKMDLIQLGLQRYEILFPQIQLK